MPGKKNSGLKMNLVYQVSYEVLLFLMPLIVSPHISRVLGAERIGVYSFSYSVAYYFQIVAGLGLKYYGTRSVAAVRDSRDRLNLVFSEILTLHVALSVLCCAAYVGYCLLFARNDRTIALIQTLNVMTALFDINWFFFGLEKFKITVTRNLIIKALSTAAILILVRSREDLWKYTLIMSLGLFLSQAVVWVFVPRYVKYVKVSFSNVLKHLKPMAVLFVPIIAVSVLKYMDKIMLGLLSTTEQVGYYENAFNIIGIPSSIIVAVGTVAMPRLANLHSSNDTEQGEQISRASYRYLLALSIGMGCGLFGIAGVLSVVYWGKDFAACAPLIRVLAFSVPFSAYSNITRTQFLMPRQQDAIYMKSTVIGMIVNLVLNLILVRRLEAVGVCIATVVSEIAITVYQIIVTRKESDHTEYIRSFLPFLIPGVVMAAAILLLNRAMETSVGSLILNIVFGAVIYLVLALLVILRRPDRVSESFLRRFKRKKSNTSGR